MSRDTDSPGDEFRVAAAGPLVTLLIVACAVGIGAIARRPARTVPRRARCRATPASTPGRAARRCLASINALVFVFNLIPAFPLDGGRIARAIAWRVTGDRSKATKVAAGLGQVFAWLLIGVGVFWLLTLRLADRLWYCRARLLPRSPPRAARSCRRTSPTASTT